MENEKSKKELTSKALKLTVLALFSMFHVLLSNHYYQVKSYVSSMSNNINVIIFFNKKFNCSESLVSKIEGTKLMLVKEYVDSEKAYLRAIKKNPFLKDVINIDNIEEIIQPYAVIVPKTTPNKKLISKIKNILSKFDAVDEVVFDELSFKHYVKIQNLSLFYIKIFKIFSIIIAILFILKCIFFVIEKSKSIWKLTIDIFTYVLISIISFIILWSIYTYMHYHLSICPMMLTSMVFFTIVLGIILE
ncbi:MAG: hypothetical protein LBC05_00765 [Endomicrobium sp.]|jgi:cell division transport system permease protein|nr:hypothetical protein [Endomicrobium sp.]